MDTINKIAKKFNLKVVEDSAQADGAAYIRKEMWHFRRCNGIETAIHYPIPIHLQEAYEDFGYKEGDFPIAEKMADEILSLPLWIELEKEIMGKIIKSAKKFLQLFTNFVNSAINLKKVR